MPGDGQSPGGHRQRASLGWPPGAKSGKLGRSFCQKGKTRPTGFSLAASPLGRAARNACPSYWILVPLSKITSPISSHRFSPPGTVSVLWHVAHLHRSRLLPAQAQRSDPGLPHLDQALVLQGLPHHPLGAAQFSAALSPLPAGRHPASRRRALRGPRLVAGNGTALCAGWSALAAHDRPLVSLVCRAGRRLVGRRAGDVSPPG